MKGENLSLHYLSVIFYNRLLSRSELEQALQRVELNASYQDHEVPRSACMEIRDIRMHVDGAEKVRLQLDPYER